MKKIISAIIIIAMMLSLSVTAFATENKVTINLRVEGYDKCLYNKTTEIDMADNMTVANALMVIDQMDDELTITGLDSGYITGINGENAQDKGGEFGWDGWYFAQNEIVSSFGIAGTMVDEIDGIANIVLYYGDYPCQYALDDFSKYNTDGIIKFYSNEDVYDDSWNIIGTQETPIIGATVTIDNENYTTDENGYVYTDLGYGTHTYQIEKYSDINAPLVCRYSDNSSFADAKIMQNDIDGNGDVNVKDVTRLQKHLTNLLSLLKRQLDIADSNGDEKIDIKDATKIQKLLADIQE